MTILFLINPISVITTSSPDTNTEYKCMFSSKNVKVGNKPGGEKEKLDRAIYLYFTLLTFMEGRIPL